MHVGDYEITGVQHLKECDTNQEEIRQCHFTVVTALHDWLYVTLNHVLPHAKVLSVPLFL